MKENLANKLQFPVLGLSNGDPMIYVFPEESRIKKTYWDFYAKGGYNQTTFIDSKGKAFRVKSTKFVKFGKFGGYNPMVTFNPFSKGKRTIYIEFEYEPQVEYISLNDMKARLKQMAANKQEFWEESFGEIGELFNLMDNAKTYEELFMIFH